MSAQRVRMTMVVADVLDVIMSAQTDEFIWGLRICERTGLGSGTVYPALDRRMKAGWIADRWENPAPADRPRRRFYAITPAGREEFATAMANRARCRTAWVHSREADDGVHD